MYSSNLESIEISLYVCPKYTWKVQRDICSTSWEKSTYLNHVLLIFIL
jgi:hypothetical protein